MPLKSLGSEVGGSGGGKGAGQHLRWHLDDEGVDAAARHIARPYEILPGNIQIALRELRIGVTAARSGQVSHHGRHDQDAQGVIQEKTHNFVRTGPICSACPASTDILLIGMSAWPGVRVAHDWRAVRRTTNLLCHVSPTTELRCDKS